MNAVFWWPRPFDKIKNKNGLMSQIYQHNKFFIFPIVLMSKILRDVTNLFRVVHK